MSVKYTEDQKKAIAAVLRFAVKSIFVKTGLHVVVTHSLRIGNNSDEYVVPPLSMLDVICKTLKVDLQDIQDKNRRKSVVRARQITIILFNKHYEKLSLKSIGRLFGGMDHTSVLHNRERARNYIEKDDAYFMEKYPIALAAVDKWIKKLPPQPITAPKNSYTMVNTKRKKVA